MHLFLEHPVEGALALKARVDVGFGDRLVGVAKERADVLNPGVIQVPVEVGVEGPGEHAGDRIGGHVQVLCHLGQSDGLGEVLGDVGDAPEDQIVVDRGGAGLELVDRHTAGQDDLHPGLGQHLAELSRLLVGEEGVDRVGHVRVQILRPDHRVDLPVLQERVAEDPGVRGGKQHVDVGAGARVKDLGVVDRPGKDDRKVPRLHVVQVLVQAQLKGAAGDVEALDKVVDLGREVKGLPLVDLKVVLQGFVERAHGIPPDVRQKMSQNLRETGQNMRTKPVCCHCKGGWDTMQGGGGQIMTSPMNETR